MTSYQVTRTHVSPYQCKDFLSLEKALIERFPDLTYVALDQAGEKETILLTNTHTQLSELPLKVLKNTRLIIHPNSGYDHFAHDRHLWEEIPLIIGHTIRAQAVAEYCLAAVFEALVELPQHMSWDKNRMWSRGLLKDTNVWIFGLGHIGKIIATTLSALGMRVTRIDPFKSDCLAHWKQGDLKSARVIISAMSLNQTSVRYFNEEFFSELGAEVLFINGARGKLVDEKALKDYLLTHPRSFAFLDVFEKEPFGEDWHGFPQVWKTSHIAGVEQDLDRRILDFEEAVLTDFLKLPQNEFFQKYENELLQNKWMKGVLV
jgi:phosphoglycerate dehydrogenase-like enzyme